MYVNFKCNRHWVNLTQNNATLAAYTRHSSLIKSINTIRSVIWLLGLAPVATPQVTRVKEKSGTDTSKSSYSSMISQLMCNSQSIYMYLQCSQIYSSASEKRKMTDYSLNSSDFRSVINWIFYYLKSSCSNLTDMNIHDCLVLSLCQTSWM